MFAFSVLEWLLYLLWGFAVWIGIVFLLVGSVMLFYNIFIGE